MSKNVKIHLRPLDNEGRPYPVVNLDNSFFEDNLKSTIDDCPDLSIKLPTDKFELIRKFYLHKSKCNARISRFSISGYPREKSNLVLINFNETVEEYVIKSDVLFKLLEHDIRELLHKSFGLSQVPTFNKTLHSILVTDKGYSVETLESVVGTWDAKNEKFSVLCIILNTDVLYNDDQYIKFKYDTDKLEFSFNFIDLNPEPSTLLEEVLDSDREITQ